MDKRLHVIFPKDYMDTIVEALEKESYTVTHKDYQLETFYHWAMAENDHSPTALIIDPLDEGIPLEAKAEEYVRYLTDIKINKPNMRLIINLPSQFSRAKNMQRNFVSLGIYDFYFEDNFSVQTILKWIENKRTLADVKSLIVHESIEEKIEEKEAEHEQKQNSPEIKNIEEVLMDEVENSFSSFINEKFGDKVKTIKRFADSFSINVNLPKAPRTQVVEKYVTMIQQSIAFISLSKGAGSTFQTLNFASYLRDKGMSVGIYEQPVHFDGRSYLADVFDFFKKEKNKEISIPHLILERKPIFLEQAPVYSGINVYATDYSQGYIEDFKSEQFIRYLNTGKHTIKIMDFGYVPSFWFNKESFMDVLNTFQQLVIVSDLLPTSFVPNFERFEFFQNFQEEPSHQSELCFLINKYDSYFPKKELKQLKIEHAHRCPVLDSHQVFKAFFGKKVPFDTSKEVEDELSITYNGLLEEMRLTGEVQYKKKRILSSMLQKVGL